MKNETEEPVAGEGQATEANELQQQQVATERPGAEDREYAELVLRKQARLVGEARALELPEAQRAGVVEGVIAKAETTFANLTDEQLQQFVAAGREGRVGECRALLGL
jgi:hypothetical protein